MTRPSPTPLPSRRLLAAASPVLIVFLLACGSGPARDGEKSPGESSTSLPAAAAPIVPTADQAAAATYKGLDVAPEITLANGRWQGPPFAPGGSSAPTATLVRDFLLTGDLDGAGADEAAVLIATSSGGSGTMNYLAVLSGGSGQVVNVGTALLGDRVAVMRARLAGRKIELDVVQAGPGDAMCCPSEKATRVFALAGGSLAEVSTTVTGTLSLADLGGVEWVLRGFDQDDPVPAEPRVTLAFDQGKIAGSAGCNRYGGRVTAGGSPGDIEVDGRLAVTEKECPPEVMKIEDRYLAALGAVERYQFLAARLALLYNERGTYRVLLFEAQPSTPAGSH
jgi:heat shock protein HslJ